MFATNGSVSDKYATMKKEKKAFGKKKFTDNNEKFFLSLSGYEGFKKAVISQQACRTLENDERKRENYEKQSNSWRLAPRVDRVCLNGSFSLFGAFESACCEIKVPRRLKTEIPSSF